MSYELYFLPSARKEWDKLGKVIQGRFKEKLTERLKTPIVPKDKLRGELADFYKIKLRDLGYRLVYEVITESKKLVVITVGKRDKSAVYERAILITKSRGNHDHH